MASIGSPGGSPLEPKNQPGEPIESKKELAGSETNPITGLFPQSVSSDGKGKSHQVEHNLDEVSGTLGSVIQTVKERDATQKHPAVEKTDKLKERAFQHKQTDRETAAHSKEKNISYHVWKTFSKLPTPVVKLMTAIVLSEADLSKENALQKYPPDLIPKLPSQLFTNLPAAYLPLLKPQQVAQLSANQLKALGNKFSEIPKENLPFINKQALQGLVSTFEWEEPLSNKIKDLIQRSKSLKIEEKNTGDLFSGIENDQLRLDLQNFLYDIMKSPHSLNLDDPKWTTLVLYALSKLNEIGASESTHSLLASAFRHNNFEAFELIRQNLHGHISENNFQTIFSGALKTTFIDMAKFSPIIMPYINTVFPNGETLLTMAVKENNPVFTEFLISKGAQPSQTNAAGESASQIALKEKQWTQLKILEGDTFVQKASGSLMSTPLEDLEKTVWEAFLGSDSRDVMTVLDDVISKASEGQPPSKETMEYRKELERIKKDFLEGGSIISRVRDPLSRMQMHESYGTGYKGYIEQQMGYALKRNNVYKGVLQQVQNNSKMDIKQVLQALSTSRSGDFSTWREPHTTAYTAIYSGIYAQLENLPAGIYKQHSIHSLSDHIETNPTGYRITHTLDDGTKLEMTQLDILEGGSKWVHTPGENLDKALKLMDRLFEEIKESALKGKGLTPETRKKIAELYWLTCNAMPFARGSSQYALELHRLCYELNGFRAPPPSQIYVLPDTVALGTPFDVFYRDYYPKIFEGEPESIVKNFPQGG